MSNGYFYDDESDELYHYGKAHEGMIPHSGRYPWGSGDDPFQGQYHSLREAVRGEKAKGRTEKEIADILNVTVKELRQDQSIERYEQRTELRARIIKMKDHGYSQNAIAKELGLPEATVRSYLDPVLAERTEVLKQTSDFLKSEVEANAEKYGTAGYLDIGPGTENQLQISRTKLETAIRMAKQDGYEVCEIQVPQMGTDKMTTVSVLTKEGQTKRDVWNNRDTIGIVGGYSEDGGATIQKFEPPVSIDSKRIFIRYADDPKESGETKDGVIELKQNVPDLSLGGARYAQVRIGVDDKYYLKGMAMYSDDIPKGYDLVFNTNKKEGTPMAKVFKEMKKDDPTNPFGASIKYDDALSLFQRHYIDPKTGERKLSPINVVQEEGDWGEWSRNLASQFLSKQPVPLAKAQLDLSYKDKRVELDEIKACTNPEIKKKLLATYADSCDAAAVHLKAAALPRQAFQVILPFNDIKENEIYAPNFRQGERVVLIRYPHGGKFEIPELTVNNKKGSNADKFIHNAADAVGINYKVAQQLSGADFDGDTVLVIPNNEGRIKTDRVIKGLRDFNPKELYKLPDSAPEMKAKTKQTEMGRVSNLITDMTLKGATLDEIERAVKHSMVVIDAQKHHLDYRQSERDFAIKALKAKYQGSANAGASTIISRASAEVEVPQRRIFSYSRKSIDPVTGRKIYDLTGKLVKVREKVTEKVIDPITGKKVKVDVIDPKTGKPLYRDTGEMKLKNQSISRMEKAFDEGKDAYSLISDKNLPMERVYADYANKVVGLANEARKEYLRTGNMVVNDSAKVTYAKEVSSLKMSLNTAMKNKPYERKAQALAGKIVEQQRRDNPNWDKDRLKKARGQALTRARMVVGAKKQPVTISPREWEAIQAGAISSNTLKLILDNADIDKVKAYAMPRNTTSLTGNQLSLMRSMAAAHYTQAEIADRLGVSPTTVSKYLKGTIS